MSYVWVSFVGAISAAIAGRWRRVPEKQVEVPNRVIFRG
jgi:hypothetical protein